MSSFQPQFSLRDYLGYLMPGVVSLAIHVVWNPLVIQFLKDNPLASSIIILVGGYLMGHICKAIGTTLFLPLRRRSRWNPYKNAFDETGKRWTVEFTKSLRAKLEAAWGKDLIEQELEFRASNIILLCWYDTLQHPSKGHDEIDRYVSLFNLSLSLIPAFIGLAIISLIKGQWVIMILASAGVLTFAKYWYEYEFAFCSNILRVWYTQSRSDSK
jgi:hypothetical protein